MKNLIAAGVVLATLGVSADAAAFVETCEDETNGSTAFSETGYATSAVQTNGWLDQSFGFQQGFDRYIFPSGEIMLRDPRPQLWAHADRVLQEASRILDAAEEKQPFFLYLHFMDVHEYASPPEFKTFGADDAGENRSAICWVDDAVTGVRRELERRGLIEGTDAERQVSSFDGRWIFARDLPKPGAKDRDSAHPTEFLFDRNVDPGENVNLLEIEPEVARAERARLDAYLTSAGDGLAGPLVQQVVA